MEEIKQIIPLRTFEHEGITYSASTTEPYDVSAELAEKWEHRGKCHVIKPKGYYDLLPDEPSEPKYLCCGAGFEPDVEDMEECDLVEYARECGLKDCEKLSKDELVLVLKEEGEHG